MEFDCRTRSAAGRRTWPLADTIAATSPWLARATMRDAWKAVLPPRRSARSGRGTRAGHRNGPCDDLAHVRGAGAPHRSATPKPPRIRASDGARGRRSGPAAFPGELDVEDKRNERGYDPVTIADLAAEDVIRAKSRASIRSRHPRRRARRRSGHVQLHVGHRPDRRHPELHPRPVALGHADRAARRRARRSSASRTSRSWANRSSAPRGGIAEWRRGSERRTLRTRRCRADRRRGRRHHAPRHFRTPRSWRRSTASPTCAADALRRGLLLLHPAGDGPDRRRRRNGAAGLRRAGADPADRGGGRGDHRLVGRLATRAARLACGDRALHADVLRLLASPGGPAGGRERCRCAACQLAQSRGPTYAHAELPVRNSGLGPALTAPSCTFRICTMAVV